MRHPWLSKENKAACHELLENILDGSATPLQFETICERIRNVDDAPQERGELIDSIYKLIGSTHSDKTKIAAMAAVYKAYWRLETAH